MGAEHIRARLGMLSANRRAAIEMVAASLFFATMASIAHGFSGHVAWSLVAFARIALSSIIALIMLRIYRSPLIVRGNRALWWRTLSGSAGLLCTFYCIAHIPVTDVVTILATSPLWVTLILFAVFRERPPKGTWFHVTLALIGVYVMQRPTFDADSFPIFVAIGGAFIVAVAQVSLSRCRDLPPISVVAHYSTFTSVICLAVFFFVHAGSFASDLPPAAWLWFIPMGIAGTIGQFLLTVSYGRGNTTMVSLTGISQIAFAATYDLLVWGHTFDLPKVIGVLMIATAIILSVKASRR